MSHKYAIVLFETDIGTPEYSKHIEVERIGNLTYRNGIVHKYPQFSATITCFTRTKLVARKAYRGLMKQWKEPVKQGEYPECIAFPWEK